MLLKNVLTIVGGIALFASCVNQPSATVSTDDSAYDQRKADSLGIPKGNNGRSVTIRGSLNIR